MTILEPRFEVLERRVVFEGFFRIVRYRLRHRLFAGGTSAELVRELFERGEAAVVLPYDPVRQEVLLVEQFRVGAITRPEDPWLLEPVAGMIEPGETAAGVARREAAEEAGLELRDLVPIGSYYPSPGGSDEVCHAFVPGSTPGAPAVCSASPNTVRTSRRTWCRSQPRSAGSRTAGCGPRAR
jgi:ADP-ribose diphosphatase